MEKSRDQLNAEADVVEATVSFPKGSNTWQDLANKYESKAIPTTIKFSSRASVKIVNNGQDHYYTIEYGEERQIPNYLEVDMDKERQMLIDDCNNQTDKQVEEIIKTFLK